MKPLIADINHLLLSTLGGCGDITRNVITCPAPIKNPHYTKLEEDTFLLAKQRRRLRRDAAAAHSRRAA